MRIVAAAIAAIVAIAGGMAAPARAWTQGEFLSNGKPVEEHHCIPTGAGPFPAVIILHGAGPRDAGHRDFEDLCAKLAEHGYYSEFIEYYSQTDPVLPGSVEGMVRDLPTWLSEVHSGIASLKKNPSVDSTKVALMGFSLGSFISLTYGATYPDGVTAIVEYYGGMAPELYSRAATMPPVLILHGDIDRIVPVSQATDLDAALTKAGRPHEMKIYPGAEHTFNFPDAMTWYQPAAATDAWNHSLKFFDTYLKSEPR
jgi:carboxymethylenebutenolidase